MRAEERRQTILDILKRSTQPVSASALAARFSVSRQIVVGDIALLRAAGADISATPRGYVILPAATGLIRQIAVRHDAAGMEAELNAIVDRAARWWTSSWSIPSTASSPVPCSSPADTRLDSSWTAAAAPTPSPCPT